MRTLDGKGEPFVVLRTKLQRPRLRGDLVARQRLLDQIDASLSQNHQAYNNAIPCKLILVSAPAGYGKTTAIGQWLEVCPCPSAWLSLDVGDSDLNVFLTYFTSAIQTVYPDAVQETTSLLKSQQKLPHKYLVSTLTNELADLPGKLLLVLDDFHHVEGESLPKIVTALLDKLPLQMCLAIITRQDPDLPLIRLRASGEMIELRMADLHFTPDEVQAFLWQSVGMELSQEIVESLGKSTEGWIVGLRLAALSLRGTEDPAALVQAFQTKRHHYVMEYLVDEVLSQQPPALQEFLLRTSILDRFCVSLCNAIVGDLGNESILHELDQANLFLIPLDFEGIWYRYHHLFQELLAHKLHDQVLPDEIAALHNRASAWFADNDFIEEALSHALAGGDQITAARLVEKNYRRVINQGQWARLRRWMKRLPESIIIKRPALLMVRCWLLHREFKLEATIPVFMNAKNLIEDPEPDQELDLAEEERHWLLGEIDGLWSQALYFLSEFELGQLLAENSWTHLPETFPYGRSGALLYWGLHSHALGQLEPAANRLWQMIYAEPESSPLTNHLYNGLCYMYRASANFPQLSQTAHEYLNAAQKLNLPEHIGFAHYHLGILHYEWNKLEKASQHFEAVINLRYYAHELSYHSSLQGLALVLQALDQSQKMRNIINAMDEFEQQTESHLLLASSRSFQARLSLLQGDLNQADRQSQLAYDGLQVEPLLLFEIPALTRAIVLVGRDTHDSLRQATTLLDELFTHAKTTHFIWRQIEILALQAMALAAQGQLERALSQLEEAVILAHQGWLVRTFVDLGAPLAGLLQQLARRDVATDYLNHLLAAFNSEYGITSPAVDIKAGIVEPLTKRELEVLLLLGQRLTNQEIAHQLTISPKTVKRHASNIFQKLSVNNRREAATKARELGILPAS